MVRPQLHTLIERTDDYRPTSPRAIATSGTRIVVIGFRKLYASNKLARFRLVGPKRPPVKLAAHDTGLLQFENDLFVEGEEIWVCGYRGVARSTNLGATFTVVPTPKGGPATAGMPALTTIVRAHDGSVWAAGEHGNLLVCTGKQFRRVRGLDASAVLATTACPLGILIANAAGRLYIASAPDKIRRTTLDARSPLHDVCVTPHQTIVAVGDGPSNQGAVYRSTDGGRSFERGKLPTKKSVYTIAPFADGRLLAGGDEGILLVSHDDGRSFALLAPGGKRDRAPKREARAFNLACTYGDGVLIGGTCQGLQHAV